MIKAQTLHHLLSKKIFFVALHDVSPVFSEPCKVIVDAIQSQIGNKFHLAVVPNWHNQWPLENFPEFVALIKSWSSIILLHGYNHQSDGSKRAVSLLTNNADEFSRLSTEKLDCLLHKGQRIFKSIFGVTSDGVSPPAWQSGCLSTSVLKKNYLSYWVGINRICFCDGTSLPLATYSWDVSRWQYLGYFGEVYGRVSALLNRSCIPSIVFHPSDLANEYMHFGINRIRQLLALGYQPAFYNDQT